VETAVLKRQSRSIIASLPICGRFGEHYDVPVVGYDPVGSLLVVIILTDYCYFYFGISADGCD
jgi:hypothetical protein